MDDVKAMKARIAKVQRDAVEEVAKAHDALEDARTRLVEAIQAAREAEVPYRRLQERTGRSVEYFRSIVHRNQ